MNQPLLCEPSLMWFLVLPIWTSSSVWRQLDFRAWRDIYAEHHTNSWVMVYFSPSSLSFRGQEVCRHWIFKSYKSLNNPSGPVLSSVLCPDQMSPVILKHCDELGRISTSDSHFGTHFLHLLCVFCLYSNEYLAVEWDGAHLELMDSSETPLCEKSLKKKNWNICFGRNFLTCFINCGFYSLWLLGKYSSGK